MLLYDGSWGIWPALSQRGVRGLDGHCLSARCTTLEQTITVAPAELLSCGDQEPGVSVWAQVIP